MASSTAVSINDSTPTLVFSGTGNVMLRAINFTAYIGGSNVSSANGMVLANPTQFNLNSTDDIYAIVAPGGGTQTLTVFSAR